jgi:catechol 2,3-dioxygenase-like lactoylglutathione lyase family enzyme
MSEALTRGGNATILVSDMDRAVAFYVETLGLALVYRTGGDWASIDAGGGFGIGLHSARHGGPQPGTGGSITVGLTVAGPIEEVVATLQARGVPFHGPLLDQGFVKLAFFTDPDGNALYLSESPSSAP